jgi:hypothetical protein
MMNYYWGVFNFSLTKLFSLGRARMWCLESQVVVYIIKLYSIYSSELVSKESKA